MQSRSNSESAESFRVACRSRGLRVTPQRQTIYQEFIRARKHPTAEQLHARVKRRWPNISLDTVNRTLLTFSAIGLAEIVEGHGSARRYDPNLGPHHHVHCIKCGDILDFRDPSFDALRIPPAIEREFKIVGKRVVLSGICPKCRRKTRK